VGQLKDPTALVIVEEVHDEIYYEDLGYDAAKHQPNRPEGLWVDIQSKVFTFTPRYLCRHIERLPLGLSYPQVCKVAADVVASRQLWVNGEKPTLLVDETGVGKGITDFMRVLGLAPKGYVITGGSTVNYPADNRVHVPKTDLVYAAIIALQSGTLEIAQSLEFAKTLRAELLAFEATVTPAGNTTFAAATNADWRNPGKHDDILLALCQALHYLTRWRPSPRTDLDPANYPVVKI
jgi:hypothetical protein